MTRWIYHFKQGAADGNKEMKDLLGGKGANLAEMSNLGLPVPPGFTVTSELCHYYYQHQKLPNSFIDQLTEAIKILELNTGKIFGGEDNPLLLSVRSGAKISMPGMMDTILNLGINDRAAEVIAAKTNNHVFAYDSYRRFIEMYYSVVFEISHYLFEEIYDQFKLEHKINSDNEITVEILKKSISEYRALIRSQANRELESDPFKQLENAIVAVLKSWMSPRAASYRKIHNINDLIGTAVNIQAMVFGNKGDNSATGVIFTRSPSDGNNRVFGEFLVNAQGEDIVAGIRTPMPISANADTEGNSMQEKLPEIYDRLIELCGKLEKHYGDMQDIEFTVEEGKLFLLQTRNGKRSAAAAVKIAVDMYKEGLISKEQALLRVDPDSLGQLLHTTINYASNPQIIATGLPASPGAASGIVVFSSSDAEETARHHKVILVRNDTSPEDIKGMHISRGVITARGGMTSHAAVVARGMGTPCVCGVRGLTVDERAGFFITSDGIKINRGESITIDGSNGKIISGEAQLTDPVMSEEFKIILSWADEIKKLGIRANAETVSDVRAAIKFGAEGVGLCRTEHMFFDNDKIPLVREMIMAGDYDLRQNAIEKLKPLQTKDFKKLFEVLRGLPINIRLLDPPLHEFLPNDDKDKDILAQRLGVNKSFIESRLQSLRELNPMLGHRGCRLGISYPEIYEMQVEAILDAMWAVYNETGIVSNLELMIPLICDVAELLEINTYVKRKISVIEAKYKTNFKIKLGTMIELPRAALRAKYIAEHVDYFSFGTNDLTQTAYGISRDDIGSFLPDYLDKRIFSHDPFVKLDEEGVGELIEIAIHRGRKGNNKLSFGVCGEHAGNPESIKFFDRQGLDYISCSPYRVPIARIAAARSKIINSN